MDLEVVGRHTLFFDDDAMAAFVNSDDALVEWNSLQIDRYDVRHLLSGPLPLRQPQNSRYSSHLADSSLDSELDHERYLDLHLLESADNQEVEDTGNPKDSGGYHTVSFSYGNAGDDSANQKIADVALEDHGYQPPFIVPENLAQSLPSTEKEHLIIARTAVFVSQHGGQSEIVLRVKQGNNPTFGFLMPDHRLHPYFRFLFDHPEFLESNVNEKTRVNENKTETASDSVNGGALTLLGSVYESGDDDEDGAENSNSVAYEKTDDSASHIISSSNVVEKEKVDVMSKPPVSCNNKEKALIPRKNPSFATSKDGHTSSLKKTDDSVSRVISVKKLKEQPLVVEPPSDIKKLIDKIVEFIAKNGKQFEAALCEQDNEHVRFSFLLPSDQYHPYYLCVLQRAQQSKGVIRNSISGFQETSVSSCELDRKEKFKMVIGKSKKDMNDSSSKTTLQENGVTVDVAAAAAILKAATRGIKIPSNSDNNNNNNIQNGRGPKSNLDPVGSSVPKNVNKDSSEAHLTEEQKLKAERRKRAKMFVAMLKSGNELDRSSSVEPVQSLNASENSNKESSVAINGYGSEIFGRKYIVDDEHMDRRSKRKYRSRSDRNEEDDDENKKEETEVSHEIDSDHRKDKSRKRRRKKHRRSHRHSRRDEDDPTDSETEVGHHNKHLKKKKHSSHQSSSEDDDEEHYNSSKYHKQNSHRRSHEYDYSSSDTDISSDKCRSNKNHTSSRRSSREDEEHGKHSKKKHRSHRSSSSRRKRLKSDSSRDEEEQDRDSRYEEEKERKGSEPLKEELEEGEISSKVCRENDQTGGVIKSKAVASQSADVPDDLRAKIRAMLLATR